MRTNKFIPLAATMCALAFSTFFMSGCKKDNSASSSEEDFAVSAQRVGDDESTTNDVDNMTSQVARHGSFTPGPCEHPDQDLFSLSTCATVTNDTATHTVTYDFGTGCVGRDGRTRRGQVIVTYTGAGYFDPGSSMILDPRCSILDRYRHLFIQP